MKKALSSPVAFRLPVLLVLGLPSALTLPLTEQFSNVTELAQHIVISLATLGLIISLASPLRYVAQLKWYRWWLTPLFSFLLGGARGASAWLLSDALGLVQQGFWTRVFVAATTWLVLLPLAGYFFYLFLESRQENSLLRSQLASAEQTYDSLEQQRSWLAKASVSGLDKELAASFVDLAKRLNEQGLGPESLRDIASELRSRARMEVRPRSLELYRQKTTPKELFREYLTTVPSANLVAAAYLVSVGLNNLRVSGLSESLPAQLLASAVIWLTIKAAGRVPGLSQFVWLFALLATGGVLAALGAGTQLIVSQSISAAIWSQALAVAVMFGSLILHRQRRAKQEMQRILKSTQVDIQALTIELESQNIEIAKYLHAILQTRLMSYAMQLESGSVSKEQLAELTALLTNPMREFELPAQTLSEGLALLAEQWEPVVKVEIKPGALTAGANDVATLQVVREAIANSVRHGLADEVSVEIFDDGKRNISVIDNGIGPRVGPAGLGTEVFNQLCSAWDLRRTDSGGAKFTARLG